MTITPIYAGVLALFFVLLSLRVIRMRRAAGVGLGDGGNRQLMRRQRVHANFAEYVPLVLVLMALAELQGAPAWLLHAIGLCILVGRAAHAYGLAQEAEPGGLRVLGMSLSFTALIGGAITVLAMSAMTVLPVAL